MKILIPLLIIIIYLFRKKNNIMNTSTQSYITDDDFKSHTINGTVRQTLQELKSEYPIDFLQKIEQSLRLETNHFKSGQWKYCGTSGMLAFSKEYPFGWSSLKKFETKYPQFISEHWLKSFNVGYEGGKKFTYIGFSDTGNFVRFKCWYIWNQFGGNVGRWGYGSNMPKVREYNEAIAKIKTQFV